MRCKGHVLRCRDCCQTTRLAEIKTLGRASGGGQPTAGSKFWGERAGEASQRQDQNFGASEQGRPANSGIKTLGRASGGGQPTAGSKLWGERAGEASQQRGQNFGASERGRPANSALLQQVQGPSLAAQQWEEGAVRGPKPTRGVAALHQVCSICWSAMVAWMPGYIQVTLNCMLGPCISPTHLNTGPWL